MIIESEKLVERKFNKGVEKIGGWSIKLLSTHLTGLPDRLCLLPGGRLFFIELKTTKRKPSKIQTLVHRRLLKLGFPVQVLDTSDKVNEFIIKISL